MELDVVVPHVQRPATRLADQGVGLDQQPIKRLAALRPIAEGERPLAQVVVVQFLQLASRAPIFGTRAFQRASRAELAAEVSPTGIFEEYDWQSERTANRKRLVKDVFMTQTGILTVFTSRRLRAFRKMKTNGALAA